MLRELWVLLDDTNMNMKYIKYIQILYASCAQRERVHGGHV